MNAQQIFVIEECVRTSHTGELTFPEIVSRLNEIGVERYHADYSRREKTFYLASGDSIAVPVPCDEQPVGHPFVAQDVESAVRQSQRGEHTYPEFIRKTMSAGCVGYFVQITGRRAIYFGRNGESHTEHFPTAASN